MVKWPTLSRNAVIALARATIPGPNCRHKKGFEAFLDPREDSISLKSLVPYFTDGPNIFITAYAVINGISEMEDYDIVGAYCLEHILMVMAAEKIFRERGFGDEYFSDMRERGFKLSDKDLPSYLFSCIGKIGIITDINHSLPLNQAGVQVRVKNRLIALKNVILPPGISFKIGEFVALHFASVFARVPEITAKEIYNAQMATPEQSPYLLRLVSQLPESIDYSNWLGQDLTIYTANKLKISLS